MSERSAKRALGNLPGKEAPNYEVGYGKPPSQTRFKPGQSGNPRGRPRGALNQKNRIPSINHEHMKLLVRTETYRRITILDGDRLVEMRASASRECVTRRRRSRPRFLNVSSDSWRTLRNSQRDLA